MGAADLSASSLGNNKTLISHPPLVAGTGTGSSLGAFSVANAPFNLREKLVSPTRGPLDLIMTIPTKMTMITMTINFFFYGTLKNMVPKCLATAE